jgi:UDP-N-acetylmuramoylalanine--D-glutamate ligase
MEIYWRTKARIFGSISLPEDACLVPISWLDRFRQTVGPDRNWITFGNSEQADYHFHQGGVYRNSEKVLDLAGTLFDNPVIGGCTGAAMGAIASVANIPPKAVETAARRFEPLPHRMQKLGEIGGVSYVNDSKATNLAAMAAAIEAVGEGVHLIAGGLPKESEYTFVKEILAERVRSIYLTGQASRAMYQAWNGVCPCVECGTLKEAFNTAKKAAVAGETILLSPGCASFDQFGSFEERGAYFDTLYQDTLRAGGDAV